MRDIEQKQDKASGKRAEEKKSGTITAGPKAHAHEGKPADAAPPAMSVPNAGSASKGPTKH